MKLGKSFFVGVLLAFVFFVFSLCILWDNQFSEQTGNIQEITSAMIVNKIEDYFSIEQEIEKELHIERYYYSDAGIDTVLICSGKMVSNDLDNALSALDFKWNYGPIPDFVINTFDCIKGQEGNGIIRDIVAKNNKDEYIWYLRIRHAFSKDRPVDWGIFLIEPGSLSFIVYYGT